MASSLIEQAKALDEAHRFREVVALLQETPQTQESVELLQLLGDAYLALDRYRAGADTLRRALVIDPQSWDAHFRLSFAYVFMGHLQAALARLHRAEALAPPEHRARVVAARACAYALVGRHARARRIAEDLPLPDDNKDAAFVLMCRAYIARQGLDYATAFALCEQALARDPHASSVYRELALLSTFQGDFAAVERYLARRRQLSPDEPFNDHLLGDIRWLQDRFADAAAAYQRALALSPEADNAARLQLQIANARYESGDVTGSLALYDQLAADTRVDPPTRSLAAFYAAHIRTHPDGRRRILDNVPCLAQKWNWCGPCALTIVARTWGAPVTQDDFPPRSGHGMLPWELLDTARRAGFAAAAAFGDLPLLKRLLDAGIPVLTLIGDANFGHYHVIFGYDERKGTLWVRETNGWRGFDMREEDYLKIWGYEGNWMAAIAPPDRAAEIQQLLASTDREVVEVSRHLEELTRGATDDDSTRRAVAWCRDHTAACLRSPYLAKRYAYLLTRVRDYDTLYAFAEQAAAAFPQQSWVLLLRASACGMENRRDESEALTRQALTIDPRDSRALHYLSDLYMQRGQWAKALYFAHRALRSRPHDENNYLNFAHIWAQKKRWTKVIAHLEAAADYASTDLDILQRLAWAYDKGGCLADADAALTRALERSPQDPSLTALLAFVRAYQGRPGEAEHLAQQAGALSGDACGVWQQMSRVYYNLRCFPEAESAARRALAARSDHLDALEALGWALWAQSRWGESQQVAQQLVNREPLRAQAHVLLGSCQARGGDTATGIATLRHALTLSPYNSWAWIELGLALRAQREWAPAEDAFLRALPLHPDDAPLLSYLAEAQEQQGKEKEALQNYQRALSLDPGNVYLHRAIALVLTRMERWDEALEWSRKAIALNDQDPWSYLNRSFICWKAQRLDEVRQNLRLAGDCLLNDPSAASNLVSAAIDTQQTDLALSALDKAIQQMPDRAELHHQRGRLLRLINRRDEAVAALQTALHCDAHLSEARYELGWVYESMGRLKEAAAEFELLERQVPETPPLRAGLSSLRGRVLGSLGYIYARLNRPAEGLSLLRRAAELIPDNAWLWREMGRVHLLLQQPAEAVPALERARALNANDDEPLELLEQALRALNDLAAAHAMYDEALKAQPTNAWRRVLYARFLWQLKRWRDAERFLHQAIRLAPHEGWAHASLADFYHRCRQHYRKAVVSYQKALACPHAETVTYRIRLAHVYLDWWQARRKAWQRFLGDALYRVAEPLYRSQERKAQQLLEQLILENPASAEPYILKTWLHYQKGEYQCALHQGQMALLYAPDAKITLWHVGTVGRWLGEWESALAAWQRLMHLEPQNGEHRGGFALTLMGAGRYNDAEREWTTALAQAPHVAWMAWQYAKCLVLLGRGIEVAQATCARSPLPMSDLNRLDAEGWLAYAAGDFRRAARLAEACLRRVPPELTAMREEYLCLLGLALLAQGRRHAQRGRRILQQVAQGKTGFAAIAAQKLRS
ncbi:MAG: tetratricopeptide repeat protein [Abditibacteriales bacterium]|nr:tetratricopeptide repeat protein [Abditibacteriales bacterium]MDW8364585.1 tetratricopeptide repeat protein [Abditibacteriales bacterium]